MSANDPVLRYAVDVVFCIDCTGSMRPYLDSVKATAREFHARLRDAMAEKNKAIEQLRVRIVEFRDLGADGPEAVVETPFFALPDQTDAYEAAVGRLVHSGGGDEPESALEALAVAILRSDWERSLDKRRHVVVMCTDASAHPLGKFPMAGAADGQSRPFPTSLEELSSVWGDEDDDGDMEYAAKRLIVFGPSAYPWNDFTGTFENSMWVESAAGAGMLDTDMGEVIEAIAGSV